MEQDRTSNRSAIPPEIERVLRLPPEASSLVLLTSTLGCSVNWLTTRYIAAILRSERVARIEGEEGGGREEFLPSVILVSWLRDASLWRNEIRRTTGLDISRYASRFTFIDCVAPSSGSSLPAISASPSSTLILDNPDVLLATSPSASAHALSASLLSLRRLVHSAVLVCSADAPLVSRAETPLERECATFLVTQAHIAGSAIVSVRQLQTGAASDVSGVMRVGAREELLYLVRADGGLKVWQRGRGDHMET